MAKTATTWTAQDPYSKPRRPPALERGAASLSLRQARYEAWALQPRSGPTVARKAAGLPQGSTLSPERAPKGWAALKGLTRPPRASRGPGVCNGPHGASGYEARPPRRLVHATADARLPPRPSLEEQVRLAGCYSRCSVSRPQARGCRTEFPTAPKYREQGHSSGVPRRRLL